MSSAILKALLTSANACLDFAAFAPYIRAIVRDRAPEYEACLDKALSEQFELVGGLMDEYTAACGQCSPYLDLGEAPRSRREAIEQVDHFVHLARDAVRQALADPSLAFPGLCIGTRATTFAFLLREDEEKALEECPEERK